MKPEKAIVALELLSGADEAKLLSNYSIYQGESLSHTHTHTGNLSFIQKNLCCSTHK
jgi:hypothetical protein